MRIRPASVEDHAAICRLFAELGVPEGPPDRSTFVADWLAHTRVAEGSAGVLGYARWTRLGALGHLRNVVVDPSARRRGVASALMDAAAAALREGGARRWMLFVKDDNPGAIALYRRHGLSLAGDSVLLSIPWSAVSALPADASVSSQPGPPDTASVRALGVEPARLAEAASQAAVRVWTIRRDDAVVALGGFDRSFPGIRPVAVATPGDWPALLHTVRADRDPAIDGPLLLPVEDDAASVRWLCARGATRLFRMIRMEGEL